MGERGTGPPVEKGETPSPRVLASTPLVQCNMLTRYYSYDPVPILSVTIGCLGPSVLSKRLGPIWFLACRLRSAYAVICGNSGIFKNTGASQSIPILAKKFRFYSILATESIFFDSIRFGNLINLQLVH